MAIDAGLLLADLKRRVRTLEDDLRAQATAVPSMHDDLRAEYAQAQEAGRVGEAFEAWREGVLTQAAVQWVLGGVFVRFLEDNGLIDPLLTGPARRGEEATSAYTDYFSKPGRATDSDRDYLLHAFATVGGLPSGERLFDREHNPVWRLPISADAARDLLRFWRRVDPDTGALAHDFTDAEWSTRFLGDLYQDLSEAAKKRYALLQTPSFVEAFLLDRTLEPALREFGLETVRMIDPTCGSGHLLLGGFDRLLARWQKREPGTNERVLVQRALDAVYGVDLNPFAVAIARFRLLVAALKASGVRRLAQAPDFKLHVATGDALLFGRIGNTPELDLGVGEVRAKMLGLAGHMEDAQEADRYLSERYHAVVGNPPYITVKDRALNAKYRTLYETCHMKYALSVPFIERFWDLAILGGTGAAAGFVGMINANSFMKREFGSRLIERFFPRVDLTHVIDTSGAYIPGHGTPTVILLGRNRAPVGATVRAVMGIRGEPSTPDDPAQGLVWTAIVEQTDQPGSESAFVSVADTSRATFGTHPWSIGGGGAADLKETVEEAADVKLVDLIDTIGFMVITGEDDLMVGEDGWLKRERAPAHAFASGDTVRDWSADSEQVVFFPYDRSASAPALSHAKLGEFSHLLWRFRAGLRNRVMFGKTPEQAGRAWYEYMQFIRPTFSSPFRIGFAEVATHNHFVLDRGGKVFTQTAPVIKLPAGASEADHLALLGLLNSSTACFWLQQVCHNKGGPGGGSSKDEKWHDFYQLNGTKVGQFPVTDEKPLDLARRLDSLAQARARHLPDALAPQLPMPREAWDGHHAEADRLLREMIAHQEELDWRCYRLYGITNDELTYRGDDGHPLPPPEVRLGERAFEIVMARRVEAGELSTIWFERHGSTPITEVPAHWPEAYRALVEARIARIESDRSVGLVERPEYKRRWNAEPWPAQAARALQTWLKTRLEGADYWPLRDGQPALQTTQTLAQRAERDAAFMAVAELYRGQAGFDVHTLVKALVEEEAVPFLPVLRYKDSGLRKRELWERTWEMQRREDAIDAEVERSLVRRETESETLYRARVGAEQKRRKAAEVGPIPRPPKYASADFVGTTFWRLRGALDVPKERFISYPHLSLDRDPSLVVGYAGWSALEQAQALAAHLNEAAEREGWPAERLTPGLAGLRELIPWIRQWHNEDGEFGPLGDFFETYLDGQLHTHGLSAQDLTAWRPPATARGRGRRPAASSTLFDT